MGSSQGTALDLGEIEIENEIMLYLVPTMMFTISDGMKWGKGHQGSLRSTTEMQQPFLVM